MMKILQQTRTQLTIRNLPVFLWVWTGVAEALGLLIIWGLQTRSATDDPLMAKLLPFFLSIYMAIAFLFTLLWGTIIICKFDKSLHCVTLTIKGLLGTQVIEYPIQEIACAKVRATGNYRSSGYQLFLVLKSGREVPLSTYGSGGLGVQQNLQKIAVCIFKFLNR